MMVPPPHDGAPGLGALFGKVIGAAALVQWAKAAAPFEGAFGRRQFRVEYHAGSQVWVVELWDNPTARIASATAPELSDAISDALRIWKAYHAR